MLCDCRQLTSLLNLSSTCWAELDGPGSYFQGGTVTTKLSLDLNPGRREPRKAVAREGPCMCRAVGWGTSVCFRRLRFQATSEVKTVTGP